MPRPFDTIRALATATAAGVAAACGQPARELAPIRVVPLVTLGADSGAGAMITVPNVSADQRGGFRIVIPSASAVSATPMVYDDSGHYHGGLATGSGDQQFETPLFTRTGPGDSIWIFDASQHAFVFDPDRRYVRSIALPASPWDAAVLSDGNILIAPANTDHPLPLLLVTGTGEPLRQIGAADSTSVPAPRWLVVDRDGTFWTMPTQFRWRLEHWDSNGTSLGVFERHPSWFQRYSRVLPITATQPPQGSILGAWLDAAGRFWIMGSAADPQWRKGIGSSPRGEHGGVITEPDKVFDTMIEAIDPRSRQMIATTRFDQAYQAVAEPGVIIRTGNAPGGWKEAILSRVILDGKEP